MKPLKELTFTTSMYRKKGDKADREDNHEALNNFNSCHFQMQPEEEMRSKLYETFKASNPNSRFVELMEYRKNTGDVNNKQKRPNVCLII